MQHHVIAAKVGRSDIRHTPFYGPTSCAVIALPLRGARIRQMLVMMRVVKEKERQREGPLLHQSCPDRERYVWDMDYVTWMCGLRRM